MSDQAHHHHEDVPIDDRLAEALADSRQHIVTRVLTRCGYTLANDAAAGENRPLSNADSFAETESRLLRSGRWRWRGGWFRRHCHPHCPSPWSPCYWLGQLLRLSRRPTNH